MTQAKRVPVGYLICEMNPAGHPVVRERHHRKTPPVRDLLEDRYQSRFVVVEHATEDGLTYTRDGETYERPMGA